MKIATLFPRQEGEEKINPRDLFNTYQLAIDDLAGSITETDDARTLLAESRQLFADQDSRSDHLNSRATSLVGLSGLLGSIAFGLMAWTSASLSDGAGSTRTGAPSVLVIFFGLVSLAYLLWGLIAAFAAIGRHVGSAIGPNDLPKESHAGRYELQLAKRTLQYLLDNYKVNNRKSDLVAVAQDRIRNGLISFIFGALLAIGEPFGVGEHSLAMLGVNQLPWGATIPDLRREFGDALVPASDSVAARFAARRMSVCQLPKRTVAGIAFEVLLLVDSAGDGLQEVRLESDAEGDAASFRVLEASLLRKFGPPEAELTQLAPNLSRVWLLRSATVRAEEQFARGGNSTTGSGRFVIAYSPPTEWDPN